MTLFHLILLAAVQGITEFLPVSSSAHLILLPQALGAADQGVVLDVAVHVGTLGAVLLYFRSDTVRMLAGVRDLLAGRPGTEAARLAGLVGLSTVPVVLGGLVLYVTGLAEAMRSIAVIGWTMLGFGLVLYWADRTGAQVKRAEDWGLRDAVVMGLWQALALIPGTSRSGITVTASRYLGYHREDGARIAMLMSIPTIIASGVLLGGDVMREGDWALARHGALAAALAFVAAYGTLAVMMRLLRRVSYTPYVVYRVIFGAVLLWIAYS